MLRFAPEQYQCQEWYLAHNDRRDAGYSSGYTLPYWLDSLERLKFPKLTENKKCDFLVVGAGIGTLECIDSFPKFWHVFHLAGITTAYHLAVRDPSKQVILIDDGEICSGETGRTTASLQTECDDHYYVIAHMFGDNVAELVCRSNHGALNFIEKVVKTEGIECEFERLRGYLIPCKEIDKIHVINKEFQASKTAGTMPSSNLIAVISILIH